MNKELTYTVEWKTLKGWEIVSTWGILGPALAEFEDCRNAGYDVRLTLEGRGIYPTR